MRKQGSLTIASGASGPLRTKENPEALPGSPGFPHNMCVAHVPTGSLRELVVAKL